MKNVAPMHSAVKNSRNGIRPVPRSESAPRTGETRALIPTLMTTAIDSHAFPSRLAELVDEVQAHRAGHHGEREDGVGEVVQRPRRGDDRPAARGQRAEPARGRVARSRDRSTARCSSPADDTRRRVRSSDVGRHVPARTDARSPGARRPATAGLREWPAFEGPRSHRRAAVDRRPRARLDRLGRRRARRRRRRSDGRLRFDRRGAGRGRPVRRGGHRRLHHQAGDARCQPGRGLVRRDAVDGQHDRPAAEPGDGHGQAQGDLARGRSPSRRPTSSPSS